MSQFRAALQYPHTPCTVHDAQILGLSIGLSEDAASTLANGYQCALDVRLKEASRSSGPGLSLHSSVDECLQSTVDLLVVQKHQCIDGLYTVFAQTCSKPQYVFDVVGAPINTNSAHVLEER